MDKIVIDEYIPKGGWLKRYRAKNSDFKDKVLVCLIFALYLSISTLDYYCLLYTSPSPRDPKTSRMPSSA